MANLAEFVESFPPGSGEREYHGALCKIVSDIAFDDRSVVAGLGLLDFLTCYDFVGAGIDTTNHPIAGSRYEDALFVAHAFEKLGHDAYWWKGHLLNAENPEAINEQREWWRKEFERSKHVEKIY